MSIADAERNRDHPSSGLKSQGELRTAAIAQPVAFDAPCRPLSAGHRGRVGKKACGIFRLQQKKLAVAKAAERVHTVRIRAFMQHKRSSLADLESGASISSFAIDDRSILMAESCVRKAFS